MKAEFDVKLQQKDLFRFNMYHSYHKVQIWLFTFLGIAILALSMTTLDEIEATYTLLYWLCSLLFIFYTPVNLYTTSKFRMREGSPLTKKLHYIFSKSGIEVSYADELDREENDEVQAQRQILDWNVIYRVIETKRQILIYTSRVNASILPKEQIEQIDELKQVLRESVPAYRLKLKK